MTRGRARFWVLFVAVGAYANAVGNDFAYDDNSIIPHNPVVTEAHWGDALLGPYWSAADEGTGLYRPVTLASFTAQWRIWGGSPLGYHVVNLLLHAGVCLLVLALLSRLVPLPAALAGALLFAVHPVHVEAVANVVGQAELVAAACVLGACVLYLDGASWGSRGRAVRLAGLSLLYLLGLGAKEIAVTLPGLLLLLEIARPDSSGPLRRRLAQAIPIILSLMAVFAAYMVVRRSVLGAFTGDIPAPELMNVTGAGRVLNALATWPQYLRLMVFPITLSVDYAPGVMTIVHSVTPGVVLGAGVLGAWIAGSVALSRKAPVVSLGLAWFVVAVLPVSNLFFPAGLLLGERTLYLPSVGVALALAGAVEVLGGDVPVRTRRLALGTAVTAGAVLLVRTVSRNPVWQNTYTVLNTQAMEHPESFLSWRARAYGLAHVGETGKAAQAYDVAVSLAPNNYAVLTEVGEFFAHLRRNARAEELLRHAVAVDPGQPTAYRLLSEMLIRQGRGREGHSVALEGLVRAGPDRELWSLVAEAYVAKGDLEAAVRAETAALALDSTSVHDWSRLAEILDRLGRSGPAEDARAHASALELDPPAAPATRVRGGTS